MQRIFEFIVAFLALLTLSPIMFLIAIVILIFDGKPIFFVQQRVGRREVNFKILKFKTMRNNSSKSLITIHHDKRITPLGNFLRKYKLDELPQLINIIKGEMSFVGPRPEVPDFVKHYTYKQKNIIFSVKPGITDPSSLKFRNESFLMKNKENSNDFYINELLPQKLSISCDYVKKRNWLSDLFFILLTVFSIFRRS